MVSFFILHVHVLILDKKSSWNIYSPIFLSLLCLGMIVRLFIAIVLVWRCFSWTFYHLYIQGNISCLGKVFSVDRMNLCHSKQNLCFENGDAAVRNNICFFVYCEDGILLSGCMFHFQFVIWVFGNFFSPATPLSINLARKGKGSFSNAVPKVSFKMVWCW